MLNVFFEGILQTVVAGALPDVDAQDGDASELEMLDADVQDEAVARVHALALELNIQVVLQLRTDHVLDLGQELVLPDIALGVHEDEEAMLVALVDVLGGDVDLEALAATEVHRLGRVVLDVLLLGVTDRSHSTTILYYDHDALFYPPPTSILQN